MLDIEKIVKLFCIKYKYFIGFCKDNVIIKILINNYL